MSCLTLFFLCRKPNLIFASVMIFKRDRNFLQFLKFISNAFKSIEHVFQIMYLLADPLRCRKHVQCVKGGSRRENVVGMRNTG